MGKRGVILVITIIVFLIVIAFLMLTDLKKDEVLLSPLNLGIHIPTDCSQTEIENTWDSIFKTPSTNLNITVNETNSEGCNSYLSFKEDGEMTYLLFGYEYNDSNTNRSAILASQIKNNTIKDLFDLRATVDAGKEGALPFALIVVFPVVEVSNRQTPLNGNSEAESELENIFNINLENWNYTNLTIGIKDEKNILFFLEKTGIEDKEDYFLKEGIGGIIYSNISLTTLTYENSTITSFTCTEAWHLFNSHCRFDDVEIKSYYDKNYCNKSIKQEEGNDCDWDNNNIIGFPLEIETERIDIEIEINGTDFNSSKIYTGKEKVEILDQNITIVEFEWDFDDKDLNFREIEIEKQPNSSSRGYLIVNGIDATKKVRIDKKQSSSNKVCIEDRVIDDIGYISADCDSSNEIMVNCPGNNSGYICNISNNRFIVQGLSHSGVVEFSPLGSCTPNWNCTSWGNCIGNKQIRTCSDLNNCGITTGRPSLNQSCISCVANWTCTSWKPENCPKNETQTRTCSDSNSCGTSTGKPAETRECTYKSNSNLALIIIIILIIAISGIIVWIVYLIIKESNKPVP